MRLTNPERVYFPHAARPSSTWPATTSSVADGIVRALRDRPCMLHRFPTGVTGEKVHQKRLPKGAPEWMTTVQVHFPAGTAPPTSCVSSTPRTSCGRCRCPPSSSIRGTHGASTWSGPDEWRIDLDPMPEATYADVRRVAHIVHEVLDELGATGWPKTSGGKGIHIYVRIPPDHGFATVRRAALAFAREVERRAGGLVDLTWWRKDRDPATRVRRLQPERP